MGLYKLCEHKGRERDRCSHPWWGSYQLRGRSHRVSLARWSGREVTSKTAAHAVLDELRKAVREGAFDSKHQRAERPGPMTCDALADL